MQRGFLSPYLRAFRVGTVRHLDLNEAYPFRSPAIALALWLCAEECISYQIPAFRLGGRMLVAFGAAANHCAFYPGAYPIEAHKHELEAYDTSKGTIRFQADSPLPAALVRKLVKTRIAERAPR